jgi:hypothetical protein
VPRSTTGDDEIFIDPSNHSAGFNAAKVAATHASVVRGACELAIDGARAPSASQRGRSRRPAAVRLTAPQDEEQP